MGSSLRTSLLCDSSAETAVDTSPVGACAKAVAERVSEARARRACFIVLGSLPLTKHAAKRFGLSLRTIQRLHSIPGAGKPRAAWPNNQKRARNRRRRFRARTHLLLLRCAMRRRNDGQSAR